jgi:(4-alkanoyl-5-oxo-2,5-dihydrofuran-3-yl)methyl phosphate reductase
VDGREFDDVPRDTAKPALVSTGMPEWLAEGVLELMDLMRAGKMDAVTDDVERVTGAKPRTYEQFARDHAAVFRGR